MNRQLTIAAAALLALLASNPHSAAHAAADEAAVGYRTTTSELPRMYWQLNLTMYGTDAEETGHTQLVVHSGSEAHVESAAHRSYMKGEEFQDAARYNYFVWAVDEQRLQELREQTGQNILDGWTVATNTAGLVSEYSGSQVDSASGIVGQEASQRLFGRLISEAQDFQVDELHIFIYAPACTRIDISVDRVNYRHIVNGVFQEGVDVRTLEDIPFELSRIETPSHISDIIVFPDSRDLGFLNAAGEVIFSAEELTHEAAGQDAPETDNAANPNQQ